LAEIFSLTNHATFPADATALLAAAAAAIIG
jgi:hypothetical protein